MIDTRRNGALIVAPLLLALPSSAMAEQAGFAAECARIYRVYPTLMLATMLEGDVDCAPPGSDTFISCNEGETPEERAARERRLAVRQHQEAGYKAADEACRLWEKDKRDAARTEAVQTAIANARTTDQPAAQPPPSNGAR